jgi:hypothetical protein
VSLCIVLGDDDGVFPAHLAGGALAGLGTDGVGNLVTDLGGPGKEHRRHPVVVDDSRAGVAEALHHVEHAVRDALAGMMTMAIGDLLSGVLVGEAPLLGIAVTASER